MIQVCVCVPAGILSELLQRENRVLHFWTLKKRRLDQCQQYLMFQNHGQQVEHRWENHNLIENESF